MGVVTVEFFLVSTIIRARVYIWSHLFHPLPSAVTKPERNRTTKRHHRQDGSTVGGVKPEVYCRFSVPDILCLDGIVVVLELLDGTMSPLLFVHADFVSFRSIMDLVSFVIRTVNG